MDKERLLNQASFITKSLPNEISGDIPTPPRVRRTDLPNNNLNNNNNIAPPSPRYNYNTSTYRDTTRFNGGLPWFAAFIQACLLSTYVIYLFLPLGNIAETKSKSPTNSPWYLYLSSRVALHGAIYLLVGAIGLYIFRRHKESQEKGYLLFYRSINKLRRVPIFTMSIVNVFLLPLWTLTSLNLMNVTNADMVLRGTVVIECIVILPCFMLYVVRVRRHNTSSPLPDAQQIMSSSFQPNTYENGTRSNSRRNSRSSDVEHMGMHGGAGTWNEDSHRNNDEQQHRHRSNGTTPSTPELRRYQADMVKWQNFKIKDLQHQVLSLVERNSQLEKKQIILQRQQLLALSNNEGQQSQQQHDGNGLIMHSNYEGTMGNGTNGSNGKNGSSNGNGNNNGNNGMRNNDGTITNRTLGNANEMSKKLNESNEQISILSSMLKDEKRIVRKMKKELKVEREMNLESSRIIESLHREATDDGHTSTSS